ncbi:hypothetical protein GCM10009771_16880 [Nesterenkonia flava]
MSVLPHSLIYMSDAQQIEVQLPGEEATLGAELVFQEKEYLVQLKPYEFLGQPSQVDVQQIKGGGIACSMGNPSGIAKDYRPRTVWAHIDGEPVTLLDARTTIDFGGNFPWGGLVQKLAGHRMVYGAHLQSEDHTVDGVRFVLDVKRSKGWGSSAAASFPGGSLLLREHGEGLVGIEATLDDPLPVWEATNRLTAPIRTLFALWLWRDVEHGHIEVHDPTHGWLTLHEFSPLHVEKLTRSKLLPLEELTAEVVAKWFSLAGTLGPIPYMAAQDISVLQTNALVKSTALEGCHRRLVNPKRGPEYKERVKDIAQELEDLIPGMFGPNLDDWVGQMTIMRNEQSHLFTNVDDFGDAHVTRYFVMATSADWTLRLTLLLQVADREMVRKALRDCNRLHMALANMDNPGFWEDYSHAETFRKTVRDRKPNK